MARQPGAPVRPLANVASVGASQAGRSTRLVWLHAGDSSPSSSFSSAWSSLPLALCPARGLSAPTPNESARWPQRQREEFRSGGDHKGGICGKLRPECGRLRTMCGHWTSCDGLGVVRRAAASQRTSEGCAMDEMAEIWLGWPRGRSGWKGKRRGEERKTQMSGVFRTVGDETGEAADGVNVNGDVV